MSPSEPVSVVITTYNRSDALLAVLQGLARQTDRAFEVIVADDGSRVEHRRTILDAPVARELGLTHVWHPDVGFTASRVRNRGVAAARHAYLIFMDGDCVPEVDFIARHKQLAATGHFVNGSRVLLSPELTRSVISGAEQICGRSAFYWLRQRLRGRASKLTHLLRLPDWRGRVHADFCWKGIRSCNMGVWRSDYECIDGFDESFVGWGTRTPTSCCACTMPAWRAKMVSARPRSSTSGTRRPHATRNRRTPARSASGHSRTSCVRPRVMLRPARMTMLS